MARGRKGQFNDRTGEDLGNPAADRVSFEDRARDYPIEVKRRGRRIALTEDTIAAYGRLYNITSQETACAALGYSVRTVNDWISKAREPECEDEMLLLLRDTHDAVETGGNNMALYGLLFEHAVDDPKTAMFLAERRLKGMQIQKSIKMDVNVSANKPPDMSALENKSPREILLLDALERERLSKGEP